MIDPFANSLQSLRFSYSKQQKKREKLDVDVVLSKLTTTNEPKVIRDRVIVLLRLRYLLTPKAITRINAGDVDVTDGIIRIWKKTKEKLVIIDKDDLFALRQWRAVRMQIMPRDSKEHAFIISLHWTNGRSKPYQRISERAINNIVNINKK